MLRPIATGKSFTHTIVAADFDNDGDLDIFLGQNIGAQWIFENSDGRGTFTQHMIAADSRGHEARVGDVDCDGDLDIVGKPWGQQNEGGEAARPPRDHVYLRNLIVDRGGRPASMRSADLTSSCPRHGCGSAQRAERRTAPELGLSGQIRRSGSRRMPCGPCAAPVPAGAWSRPWCCPARRRRPVPTTPST